jgi:hypothetical protein
MKVEEDLMEQNNLSPTAGEGVGRGQNLSFDGGVAAAR